MHVKTLLRSIMGEGRLSGTCMLRIHRKQVNSEKDQLIEKVFT